MLCVIWYNLYNLEHVENTNGRVLLLVKLQASNGNKSGKASDIINKKMGLNLIYRSAMLDGLFVRFLISGALL